MSPTWTGLNSYVTYVTFCACFLLNDCFYIKSLMFSAKSMQQLLKFGETIDFI